MARDVGVEEMKLAEVGEGCGSGGNEVGGGWRGWLGV